MRADQFAEGRQRLAALQRASGRTARPAQTRSGGRARRRSPRRTGRSPVRVELEEVADHRRGTGRSWSRRARRACGTARCRACRRGAPRFSELLKRWSACRARGVELAGDAVKPLPRALDVGVHAAGRGLHPVVGRDLEHPDAVVRAAARRCGPGWRSAIPGCRRRTSSCASRRIRPRRAGDRRAGRIRCMYGATSPARSSRPR